MTLSHSIRGNSCQATEVIEFAKKKGSLGFHIGGGSDKARGDDKNIYVTKIGKSRKRTHTVSRSFFSFGDTHAYTYTHIHTNRYTDTHTLSLTFVLSVCVSLPLGLSLTLTHEMRTCDTLYSAIGRRACTDAFSTGGRSCD